MIDYLLFKVLKKYFAFPKIDMPTGKPQINDTKKIGSMLIKLDTKLDALRHDLTPQNIDKRQPFLEFIEIFDTIVISAQSIKDPQLLEGLNIILEQILTLFNKYDIVPIQAINQPFNSALHKAIDTIDVEKEKNNLIISEIKKGFLMNQKILRYSEVIVGTQP